MSKNEDSKLIKEFKQSDVQRLRNIIGKKFGDSTKIQVGFDKDIQHHKEGDVWVENGKNWTIRNGIKRNITQFEDLKKSTTIPSFCPECGKFMNHVNDKKIYMFHNKCLDCHQKFETELKRLGQYEDYEKDKIKNNIEAYLEDLEVKFHEFLNEKLSFMSEQGDSENWQGNINKEQTIKEFNEYVASIKTQFNII